MGKTKTELTEAKQGQMQVPVIKKKPYKYMHTINNQPAEYIEKEQIVYASKFYPLKLVDTLQQIKRNEIKSTKWRLNNGYESSEKEYGWMKVFSL